MNKEDVMEKLIKIVLILAGLSLLYLIAIWFLPPTEGIIWVILMSASVFFILTGFIILVYFRDDYRIPRSLRIIGVILFIIFILIKLRVWLWFS